MDRLSFLAALTERGFALSGVLLDEAQCADLVREYADEHNFRKRVVMARHGYGQGEYQYFDYPLPPAVATLREEWYAPLAGVANEWAERMRSEERYPPTLGEYLERCHQAGQPRPTPLMLKYGAGDYNCLHQDLYGPLAFPLQMTVLLSDPESDFAGGNFLLVEQRPRMQSRAHVLAPGRGEAVVFAVNQFPRLGSRGYHRVRMRHGVGEVLRGERYTLGIIFHDAR
jgi:hypothetical protein